MSSIQIIISETGISLIIYFQMFSEEVGNIGSDNDEKPWPKAIMKLLKKTLIPFRQICRVYYYHGTTGSLWWIKGIPFKPAGQYSSENPHDDVIKWKHFPCYWSFVRGIQRPPVDSPHKGQWRGALIFFICTWTKGWVNNRGVGDLRRHRAHYDVIVMRGGYRIWLTFR